MSHFDSERDVILAGVRSGLADVAKSSALVDEILASDPSPKVRRKAEAIRRRNDRVERGFVEIVKMLGAVEG